MYVVDERSSSVIFRDEEVGSQNEELTRFLPEESRWYRGGFTEDAAHSSLSSDCFL